MANQTAPAKSNVLTFADLEAFAKDLGEQAGKGKDTQIKFGLKVVEGAFVGTLDRIADKHGVGYNDATKLAETYYKAQTGATIFDAKSANQRKLVSCVNKLIELGNKPFGVGEPMGTVNAFISARQAAKATGNMSKKLDDAFNALMRFAREQVKIDHLIDPADFAAYYLKNVPDAATEIDYLEAVRKKAIQVKNGKGGLLGDTSTQDAIIQACTKRIKMLISAHPVAASTPPVAA